MKDYLDEALKRFFKYVKNAEAVNIAKDSFNIYENSDSKIVKIAIDIEGKNICLRDFCRNHQYMYYKFDDLNKFFDDIKEKKADKYLLYVN